MPHNSWFQIGETQELLPCTDEDLARVSAPRLPDVRVELAEPTIASKYLSIRFAPVLDAGGTSMNPAADPTSSRCAWLTVGSVVAAGFGLAWAVIGLC